MRGEKATEQTCFNQYFRRVGISPFLIMYKWYNSYVTPYKILKDKFKKPNILRLDEKNRVGWKEIFESDILHAFSYVHLIF